MVHAVEELLEIHVHHHPAAFLDVLLRLAHGVVRAASRSETVAVLGERRVESRLKHLQDGLLDEPVERRRDPELSDPATALRDFLPLHRLRLVGPRDELLADLFPVLGQVLRQLVHGHPVDAGTALVLPHALQCRLGVAALDHLFHQAVRSWALVSVRRRRRFAAPLATRGFTPTFQWELQLPGRLAHGVFETHGRPALLLVRPFALNLLPGSVGGGHPCPAPRALLRPLLTSRSAACEPRRPFRREARSPQVRVVAFPAQPPDLRRLPLVARASRSHCPLALVGAASYPVPVRRLAVSLPASFSAPLAVGALRFARGPCDRVPQRTFTSWSRPCWAHNEEARGDVAPGVSVRGRRTGLAAAGGGPAVDALVAGAVAHRDRAAGGAGRGVGLAGVGEAVRRRRLPAGRSRPAAT